MKIAICDDMEMHLKIVEKTVKNVFEENNEPCKVFTYSDGKKLLRDNEQYNYDAICLDIDMPIINGFEIAEQIRKKNENAIIIFITSKNDLVYESLSFRPFSFIRKENMDYDMKRTMKDLFYYWKSEDVYLTMKNSEATVRWRITDITFIESFKNNLVVHRKNDSFEIRANLSQKERELSKNGFIRTHISYLVNYRHIEKMNSESLTLDDGTELAISRRRYTEVRDKLKQYMLNERN